MTKRIVGVCVLMLSLVTLVFAGFAYFELDNAGRQNTRPSADSMPLTKIIGPELFDTETKPADVAGIVLNRIYAIGGGGIALAAIAALILAMPQSRRIVGNESS